MASLADIVQALPKAELHLHIEGSLEPELMMALAERNGVKLPFNSVEEIKAAYEFSNLQEFLDIYYQGMSVLQTTQDFYDLTMAYLGRAHKDNVKHVEIFFDPQGHTERGVEFATAIDGILDGLAEGEKQFGITSHLIMSFLRHLSEEEAFTVLEQSKPWHDRILGVGLDSSELGHPPSKFTRVFAAARALGLKAFAHGGEEGPPEYVWECLDQLQVDRLDHGNRALEDPKLVERLVEENIALTVCPLSNLKLCVVDNLHNHPLKKMLDLGLKATINSDDPSYFGGYVGDNYLLTAEALGLGAAELARCARNAFEASFMDKDRKQQFYRDIEALIT